ncbi:sensor domain-containing diguanylate cyclase [Mycolicibacterium austroafricanum]|uniref:sensor domain-containing diguanylate cyclase n=1 Tax=Mycolicibacterium austroafricanum TaxID=39687 RepID=UPI001CA35BA2|nr:sensor domain-containing diguanylate cyclase [Mycolicibacterium austroafricanum]QZT58748.1 sensor domain-containing diguanylate cyclase [Mycolicibacterium austroafricanum]
MDRPDTGVAPEAEGLARWGRAAVVVVFVVAALDWVGWASGVEQLTRIYPTWPQMTPWSALWLAALGAAILVQSGRPSRTRVWVGRGVAATVGALAVVVLLEYAIARSFGLDQLWFAEAVGTLQSSWPGRPSPQTASSVLSLAAAIGLARLDRRWVGLVWTVCVVGGGFIPLVAVAAYFFGAIDLVDVRPSTGMAISTALALLLLVAATSVVRTDRPPLAWLLTRPDRGALVRWYGLALGFPILVALSRQAFLALGRSENAAFALSVLVCTVFTVLVGFRVRHQEQSLLIEKEQLSRERADAEERYHILADNAVDIIVHLRGRQIVWVSPSVEAALGRPPQWWIGSDFTGHVHPDDLDAIATALQKIAGGESVLQRFRARAADGEYHWIDGHGKPYVDADGNPDGLIAALRIADDRVEVEHRLERLARFDALTGLANRAEALDRLQSALEHPPAPGTHLGILFCDVDHFKDINDTWGHSVGDTVLTTLAARIRESVRKEDTVGRTGGDEILVVLPGLRSIDELVRIGEKIRCRTAEPIHVSGNTIHATLSIGAAIALTGEPASSATARADAAMYQAKSGSRNAVILVDPTQQHDRESGDPAVRSRGTV